MLLIMLNYCYYYYLLTELQQPDTVLHVHCALVIF